MVDVRIGTEHGGSRVLVHARALLTSAPEGATVYVEPRPRPTAAETAMYAGVARTT